jgi:RNA polymerase sigma factor (sigma-70 family)
MGSYVRDAKAGNPVAMSLLLEDLAARLGPVCGAIALDRGDDALQESLLIVMRSLASLRDPNALYAWARRIAVRESLRVVTGRRELPLAEFADAPVGDEDIALAVDVRSVLRDLSPAHRVVLVLRHVEGMSEQDVAGLLDVSVGTVKSRHARAREAFMARWRDDSAATGGERSVESTRDRGEG